MNKLWRVALYEFQRNVSKKSFLITLMSVPLMFAASIGTGFLIETMANDYRPVGYVDQAGVLARAVPAPFSARFDRPVQWIPFTEENGAAASLRAGELQAYYLIPANYRDSRHLKLVSLKNPGRNVARQFEDFLQINLLASQPRAYAYRASAGTEVIVRSLDGRREVPGGGPTLRLLMPLMITGAFLTLVFMSSGYLMSALAEEKENRTIEILATSISSQQMIGGKVCGVLALSLTMILAWITVVALGIFIANQAGVGWFQDQGFDWEILAASTAIAIPAFVLAAALMAALGAMVTTDREGQTLSTIFVILHVAPLYISWSFINNPHSSLAVILSLLPFTSLVTVGMRSLFASVPAWQVAASACVQAMSALAALWLAGRAFRLGLLRYGQRLSWRSLFHAEQRREGRPV